MELIWKKILVLFRNHGHSFRTFSLKGIVQKYISLLSSVQKLQYHTQNPYQSALIGDKILCNTFSGTVKKSFKNGVQLDGSD